MKIGKETFREVEKEVMPICKMVENKLGRTKTVRCESCGHCQESNLTIFPIVAITYKRILSLREKENKKKISELKAEKEGIIEKVYEMIMKTGSIDSDYVVRKLKEQFKKEVSK